MAESVDEYIAGAPDDARPTLDELRKAIKAAAPQAAETISYQIPTYKLDGHLVAFGGWKKHVGFYVMSTDVMDKFSEELKPYGQEKATVRFPIGEAIPAELVQRMVKARIAENTATRDAKAANKRQKG